MTKIAGGVVVCLAMLSMVACSPEDSTGNGGNGGTSSQGGAGGTSSQGGGTSSAGGMGGGTSSQGGAGGGTSSSGGTGGSVDPFEPYRIACVENINAHRATKGLPALARWIEAEPCVDQQASEDAMTGQAHGAWLSGNYGCNGKGQNECPGWGAEGIESCLDSMWSEKDQPGCSGCDQCNESYDPSCPSCDFYGQTTGDVCGHYANMIAKYVSRVACGFSSQGGWDAINFD